VNRPAPEPLCEVLCQVQLALPVRFTGPESGLVRRQVPGHHAGLSGRDVGQLRRTGRRGRPCARRTQRKLCRRQRSRPVVVHFDLYVGTSGRGDVRASPARLPPPPSAPSRPEQPGVTLNIAASCEATCARNRPRRSPHCVRPQVLHGVGGSCAQAERGSRSTDRREVLRAVQQHDGGRAIGQLLRPDLDVTVVANLLALLGPPSPG